MKILVTGGLGYIGSHTAVELLNIGHDIVIVDNLVNSNLEVLDTLKEMTNKKIDFYAVDVTNINEISKIFEKYNFDAVIHFAGLKAVGESMEKPLLYYNNNLNCTIVIAEMCLQYSVNKIIFSSSATIYGNNSSPLFEDMNLLKTTNPYGETKAMSERIFTDFAKVNSSFQVTLLRYFNPVGAHKSGLIGENPKGLPNNLMPFIAKVANGELEELKVFGDDYNTFDGTGVRDYIHVVDLAKGHVKALEFNRQGISIFNLGTGKGTSVLELIDIFQKVNHVKVPYKIVGRRFGDIDECYADVSKSRRSLGWKTELTIGDMAKDTWNFIQKNSIIEKAKKHQR